MIWYIVVGVLAFALGVVTSYTFWRKPAVVQKVLAPGKYRIVRSDGATVYSGNDSREARRVYIQTELRRGEHVDFFDDGKWRGRRIL